MLPDQQLELASQGRKAAGLDLDQQLAADQIDDETVDDFFNAIRKDLPYNEVEYGAKSTLTAIMGRMAAYSGKVVEWDAALNSNFTLAPEIKSMEDAPPVLPDKDGLYAIPIAGKTIAF